jgi:hypothetical protein
MRSFSILIEHCSGGLKRNLRKFAQLFADLVTLTPPSAFLDRIRV